MSSHLLCFIVSIYYSEYSNQCLLHLHDEIYFQNTLSSVDWEPVLFKPIGMNGGITELEDERFDSFPTLAAYLCDNC